MERAVIPPDELEHVLNLVWNHELRPHAARRRLTSGRISKFIETKEGPVPSFPPATWEKAETEETVEVGGMDDAVEAVKKGKMDLHTANVALQQLEPFKGYRIVSERAEDREEQEA